MPRHALQTADGPDHSRETLLLGRLAELLEFRSAGTSCAFVLLLAAACVRAGGKVRGDAAVDRPSAWNADVLGSKQVSGARSTRWWI